MTDLLQTENKDYQSPYRLASIMFFLGLAYFVSAKVGLAMPYVGSHITLIWLPTGIAVTTLVRWGYRCWPGIFIGALATNYSIDSSLMLDASIALGNTLAPMLTALLLRRFKFHSTLDRAYDILLLVLAAAFGMLLSASGGVFSLFLFKVLSLQDLMTAWFSWWAGDFIGVLLAAPLALNLFLTKTNKSSAKRVEFVVWSVTMLVICWAVFFLNNNEHGQSLPLAFIILPLVVWSSMRFGLVASSLCALLPVFIAALATSRGLGPFTITGTLPGLLLLWLFIVTLVLINLMVAALQAARNRSGLALQESELQLRTIIETEPECVQLLAKDGTVLQINPAGLLMLGADKPDQIVGKKALTVVTPQHRKAFAALINRVFEGESGHLEFEVTGLNGVYRWLETHAVPMRNAQGKITSMLGITRDITEHKKIDEGQRIAAVAFDTQDGIMITDIDAKIVRVNQAFQNITGYYEAEVIGQTPRILQSGRHDAAFYQSMWSTILTSGKWKGEIWDKRKNGEIYPKLMTITAVHDKNQQVTNYVAVFQDISHLKQSAETIHQLAFYDPLTSLPNRRLLLDRLQQTISSGTRSGRHSALLFLDLDHFKIINDTQGHSMGDLLLIEVARRLQDCVREDDTVARLGGDEFVVVLESLSGDAEEAATQTELVGEKIRQELDKPYMLNHFECLSTVSIGICLFRGHLESTEDLLQHADVALYQAKMAGRNAIRFFDPHMQTTLDMRAGMEADLRHALDKQQFLLHYQIQMNNLRHPLGAEVLLRWEHPERGLVSPIDFIPLAEETGLIVPIGLWVLKTACAQLKEWQNNVLTRDLTLAVNVSARQFRHADFVAQVQRVLLESGAKPSRLKLELTESTVLENVENTISKMREIKTLGVSFSMDDFGTGYSSLQYLKRLPLNQIKIDQSFVRDIATDLNDAAIVQTIIAMTEALGLDVIAEGVETEAQLEFLELRGCHAFQGYLFGKPITLDKFEDLLRGKQ